MSTPSPAKVDASVTIADSRSEKKPLDYFPGLIFLVLDARLYIMCRSSGQSSVYPYQPVGDSVDNGCLLHRFVISAPDLNMSGASVEYAADYTRFHPHLYSVALFPLVWDGEPARFQDLLCIQSSSRVNFKALIRCCIHISWSELISRDPLSVVCIRGEYTRNEYRQKKTSGFSRKTGMYLQTIRRSIRNSQMKMTGYAEHNLVLLYHGGGCADLSGVVEKFEEFSQSRER